VRKFLMLVVALCLVAATATAVLGAGGKASQEANAPEVAQAPFIGDADGNRISDDLDLILSVQSAAVASAEKTYPVVVLLTETPSDSQLAVLKTGAGSFATKTVWTQAVSGFAADLTAGQIAFLAKSPSVRRIDNDRPVRALLNTATQWVGVRQARTDFGVDGNRDGSATTYSKTDVVICVIDTGIDASHVDLDGGKVIGWKDCVNGLSYPYDDHGHGTHCAGIAAGSGDGNPAYRGVAPGAALVGVKVLDYIGSGSTSAVIGGVNWMIANRATYGIRIGSMSLGSAGPSDGTDSLSVAVNNAVANGIVMCVAAGNAGPDVGTVGCPGAAASAITVGAAVDPGEYGWALADFSSRGPTGDGRTKPDICAPGYAITSVYAGTGNGYTVMSGTSMATPFCAGVVALLLDANYALTDTQVKGILFDPANVRDFGPAGKDNDFGHGIMLGYRDIRQAGGYSSWWSDGLSAPFYSGSLSGAGDFDLITFSVNSTTLPLAVTLLMDNWTYSVDFDLFLRNPSGTVVSDSLGITRQETILYRPLVTGNYSLEVRSYSGSGSYWLNLSLEGEPGQFRFSAADYTVSEGVTTGAFAVDRVYGSRGTCTVDYSVSNGTALGGADYSPVSGTLTFGPGVARQTVQVPITDDLLIEPSETFYLHLSNPTNGATLATPADATVTITDNDTLRPPQTPTASTSADGILLRWQPPPGPVPGGYEIHIATTSTGAYTKVKDVTSWPGAQPNAEVTAADFEGTGFTFTSGRTYFFKLRSFFDLGPGNRVISTLSSVASAPAGPLPPLAPANLTAVTSADGIRLNWLAPASGVTPTGYEVYVATTSAGPFTTLAKTVTAWDGPNPNCEVTAADFAGTGFTFSGGRTYYFQVRSYYVHSIAGRLVSGPSSTASAVAGPIPPLAPGSVTAATSATGIHLGWAAPASGVAPQGYDVSIAAAATGPWTLVKSVTSWEGAAPNCEVTVLDFSDGHGGYTYVFTVGRTYYFQLRSYIVHPIAGRLASGPSTAASAKAGPPLPGAPAYPTATTTASGPATGVHLGWKPPATGPAPAGYSVWISAISTGTYTFVKDVTSWSGPDPNCDITVLDFNGLGQPVFSFRGGVRYYFKLYSYTIHPLDASRIASTAAATTSATAGPPASGAPTYPTATTTASGPATGIHLGWKAPATGPVPAGYSIWISATSTGVYTFVRDVTSWSGIDPNCDITVLDFNGPGQPVFSFRGGVRYYFKLYSYTIHPLDASRIPSVTAASTSATAGPPAPGAPTYPTATTTASGPATGIHFGWKAPATGPVPAGYSVWISATSTGAYTFVKDVTSWEGAFPNCDITVLDFNGPGQPVFSFRSGVRYYFKLYSYTIHPLDSSRIPSVTAASASATAGPSAPGAPTSPTGATAPLGVTLGWRAPTTGAVPAGYAIWISTTSMGTYTFVKDVTTWGGTYPNVTITAEDLDGTDLGGGVVEPVFAFNGGVRYYFRIYSYVVHALDSSHVPSTTAASASAVAGPLPPNAPTSPVGATAADGFTLRWTAPTTGIAPTGYSIELSPSPTTGFVLLPDVTSWSGPSPNVAVTGADMAAAGLTYTPGATYYARIHSFAPHPVSGDPLVSPGYASASVVAGPLPPTAPLYPAATTVPAASGGGMNLTWRAPTSGPAPVGYQVYASPSSTSGFVLVKDVTSWTGTYPNCRIVFADFTAAGLTMTPGTRYYFRIFSYTLHPATSAPVLSLRYGSAYAVAG